MKNLFTFCFLAIAMVSFSKSASAQAGQFNLSVDLEADVFSITMGASPDVSFVYTNAADYTVAKTVSKEAHFTVVSNRPYNVSMTATDNFATTNADIDVLPLSVVSATIDATTLNGGEPATVPLSTTPASPLLAGAFASVGAVHTVNFTIQDPSLLLNHQGAVYNTNVTYTVTQP